MKINFLYNKHHSLIDRIYEFRNLKKAYRLCARNSSASGIDKVSWYEYRQNLDNNIKKLSDELKDGSYVPKAYREVLAHIRGKIRLLHIPSIQDRVVQKTIVLCLKPIYNDIFLKCSLGYRYGKNKSIAIEQAGQLINSGMNWIADLDINSFSQNVKRQLLEFYLAETIADGKFLRLIQTSLGQSNEGLPIGNGLTSILLEVYLYHTDLQLINQGILHLRFCDSFLVFEKTKQKLKVAMLRLDEALANQQMSVNSKKIIIWHNPNANLIFSRDEYYKMLERKRT